VGDNITNGLSDDVVLRNGCSNSSEAVALNIGSLTNILPRKL